MANFIRYTIKKCSNPDCDATIIIDEKGELVSFEEANIIDLRLDEIIRNHQEILLAHGHIDNESIEGK